MTGRQPVERIQDIARRLRITARWIVLPPRSWRIVISWYFGAVVVVYLAHRFASFKLEPSVRWAGLGLQYGGLAVVVMGLMGRGKVFRVPHPIRELAQWVRARPWIDINATIHMVECDDVVVAVARMDAKVDYAVDPGAPIEKQLAALAKNLRETNRAIDELRGELEAAKTTLSQRVDDEHAHAGKAVADLRDEMRKALASDLGLEWAGVALLVFGLFLSTASLEIACSFGSCW